MSNETEDQPKVLVSVDRGIAKVESDQSLDIFEIDWDTLREGDVTVADLRAKREDLDFYEGESWYDEIAVQLDKVIRSAVNAGLDQDEEQDAPSIPAGD